MRLFRQPVILRVVAAVLAVAVGLTLAPTASADARAEAVRAVLDDKDAFEAALTAARASDDPVMAFAEAYAEATDGAVSAEAVARILDGASMSGLAPVPPTDRVVRAPAAGPMASAFPVALAVDASVLADLPGTIVAGGEIETSPSAVGVPAQPRGP